jgi:hypothetical protein
MVVSSHVGKLGMEVATLHPVNEVSIDLQDGPNALHSVQLNEGSQQALPLGQMLDASHTLVHAYAGLALVQSNRGEAEERTNQSQLHNHS